MRRPLLITQINLTAVRVPIALENLLLFGINYSSTIKSFTAVCIFQMWKIKEISSLMSKFLKYNILNKISITKLNRQWQFQ